ncbi:unnamed protein product [Pieris macdunnoughi]|uniref:Uncharacterized protein n=1 Tax=Pieris macdunnoughi TaxID=345717 RepID=A0A821XMD2_9NEOP|nr:unnamed protein product [Pieris macdunnoughi]
MMALKQLAIDERPRFPRAPEITEEAFYTDDLICRPFYRRRMQHGNGVTGSVAGITLRKWASNEPNILKKLTFKGDLISKTLGVYWNPKEECFMFQIETFNRHLTSRIRRPKERLCKIYRGYLIH